MVCSAAVVCARKNLFKKHGRLRDRQIGERRSNPSSLDANSTHHPLDVMWLCMDCHVKHDPRANGERQGSARLTEDEVKQIRALAQNMSRSTLAQKFNVSYSTIVHVIKRHNWNHVE
jgi:hypothetical protein